MRGMGWAGNGMGMEKSENGMGICTIGGNTKRM